MGKVVNLRSARNPVAPRVDVCVLGLGATGLPLAVALARAGAKVRGVEEDPATVAAVSGGRHHHVDADLVAALRVAVGDGSLAAATEPGPAEVFIVTSRVDYDPSQERAADFSKLNRDLARLAPFLGGTELIVLETSGPIGMTAATVSVLAGLRSDLNFKGSGGVDLAYVGERPRPGRSFEEVAGARAIGGFTASASKRAAEFYRARLGSEVAETDHRTAELVKLVENAYRDLNIAFANELSMICGEIDIDVLDVITIANHHPRVEILRPGPGVGGRSIAVDSMFLAASCPNRAKLISTARVVNEAKPTWSTQKIVEIIEAGGIDKIACLGLTSKPGADQFDESPAIEIARALTRQFPGRVVCADPYQDLIRTDLDLQLIDIEGAMAAADLVVFLVAHDQFRDFRPADGQTVIDLCGATDFSSVLTLIRPRSA